MSSRITRFALAAVAAASLSATPVLAQSTQTSSTPAAGQAGIVPGTTIEFRTATRLPGITLEPEIGRASCRERV